MGWKFIFLGVLASLLGKSHQYSPVYGVCERFGGEADVRPSTARCSRYDWIIGEEYISKCHLFEYCTPTGSAIQCRCHSGQYFNYYKGYCVPGTCHEAYKHRCRYSGRRPTNHCERYISCEKTPSGYLRSIIKRCPPGKEFSRRFRKCLPKALAGCSIEYPVVPTPIKDTPEYYPEKVEEYQTTKSPVPTAKPTTTKYTTTPAPIWGGEEEIPDLEESQIEEPLVFEASSSDDPAPLGEPEPAVEPTAQEAALPDESPIPQTLLASPDEPLAEGAPPPEAEELETFDEPQAEALIEPEEVQEPASEADALEERISFANQERLKQRSLFPSILSIDGILGHVPGIPNHGQKNPQVPPNNPPETQNQEANAASVGADVPSLNIPQLPSVGEPLIDSSSLADPMDASIQTQDAQESSNLEANPETIALDPTIKETDLSPMEVPALDLPLLADLAEQVVLAQSQADGASVQEGGAEVAPTDELTLADEAPELNAEELEATKAEQVEASPPEAFEVKAEEAPQPNEPLVTQSESVGSEPEITPEEPQERDALERKDKSKDDKPSSDEEGFAAESLSDPESIAFSDPEDSEFIEAEDPSFVQETQDGGTLERKDKPKEDEKPKDDKSDDEEVSADSLSEPEIEAFDFEEPDTEADVFQELQVEDDTLERKEKPKDDDKPKDEEEDLSVDSLSDPELVAIDPEDPEITAEGAEETSFPEEVEEF